MSRIKDLLDEVAAELGTQDPNDPEVIQEAELRLQKQWPPECGVDCHCDSSESCK